MASWDKLTPGEPISGYFLLREFQVGVGKNGKRYLTLTLGTREGDIEGKLWDDVEAIEPQLVRNVPVRVEGLLGSYREKLQVTVRTLVRVAWNDQLFTELVPASRFSREELEGGLRSMLQSLVDPWLRTLADRMLAMEDVTNRFFEAPAAKGMHHAYVRGLCEHTLSMMRSAQALFLHYDQQFHGLLNRDELLMGVFLHDLGKTVEYTYLEGIDFSLRGRLVGHLALGLMALNEAIASIPGFPPEQADRLRHLILAHHGEPEKGSPVWPITAEALLLHHIDHLDAEMNAVGMLALQAEGDEMTAYSSKFGRRFVNPFAPRPTSVSAASVPVESASPASVPAEPVSPSSAPVEPEMFEPSAPVPTENNAPEGDASRSKPRPKKGLTGPSLL